MMLPSSRGIDLRELLEHKFVVLGRDSDSSVSHFSYELVTIRLGAHPHAPARWREVDRVAEEIAEDVSNLLAVGEERRQVRRQMELELETLLRQQRLVQSRHLLHDVGEPES